MYMNYISSFVEKNIPERKLSLLTPVWLISLFFANYLGLHNV